MLLCSVKAHPVLQVKEIGVNEYSCLIYIVDSKTHKSLIFEIYENISDGKVHMSLFLEEKGMYLSCDNVIQLIEDYTSNKIPDRYDEADLDALLAEMCLWE